MENRHDEARTEGENHAFSRLKSHLLALSKRYDENHTSRGKTQEEDYFVETEKEGISIF